ncbi:glycosyltransferase [Butyrivibrio sp. AE3006]|uniref:glycosyltransferase n=1 Tax=Butyrivibrio sp. AE3006 TaxID=1280673 RepID=UPI0004049C8E|nr:glycosyltransferase [Butyrivibrio sp. AE3006]
MNEKKDLAPIVFFSYNRKNHVENAIRSLLNNKLASESELYIFSDGAKSISDEDKVNDVREYLSNVTGFKKIHYIFREKNYGMKRNIIDGISSVINVKGSVIVVEDDIVVGKRFLEYMNRALDLYTNEKKVMAISSYTPPVNKAKLDDYYFLPWFNCWGWATWEDRWRLFDDDVNKLVCNTSKREINHINYNGSYKGMWEQVLANNNGSLKSWAIFFFVAICKNNGLVLYSKDGFSSNIGADGSGESCGKNNDMINVGMIESDKDIDLPYIVENSKISEKAYENYYKNNFYWRGDLKRRWAYLKENGFLKTLKHIIEVLNER